MSTSDNQTGSLSVSALVRVALIVSDLERSTDFYRRCLNQVDVFWEGVLEGESLERLLGLPSGTHCRARILSASPENMGMIGLFELADQPAVQKSDQTSHRGEAFLVFYASDLDEVVARLAQGNHKVLCPPTPLIHEGRVKQREMSCFDPDGCKINLIEWDPGESLRPEHDEGQAPSAE